MANTNIWIPRRDLLLGGVAGLVTLGNARLASAAKPKAKRIPIGVQLWSVRDLFGKNPDDTLKQMADLGFEAVEFAGYSDKYKNDPEGLRKLLDQLKLKVAGTHIGSKSFAPENLQKTIDFHKTIGCSFLVVPGDGRFTDPLKSVEYAKVMTDAAAALKSAGLFVGHHNHTVEFKKDGDKTYWDLFAARTSKDVILQLDVGHATEAGQDAAALIKQNPKRIRTTHIKAWAKDDSGKKPLIGQDQVDWTAVLKTAYASGGVEWFLVEQERYPDGLTSLEATRTSLQGLQKLLKAAKLG